MIRLKKLLESGEYSSGKNPVNTKDPNYVQYWMIKHAPSIAQQLGETTSRLLGGGLNGLAWLLQSGRVMKLTPDKKEVAAASRYRTKQTVPHLVAVYDVRPITGPRADIANPEFAATADPWFKRMQADRINQTEPWYVIIMDHVTPLTYPESIMWFNIMSRYLDPKVLDAEVLDRLKHESDFPATRGKLATGWIERLMQQRSSVIAAFRRNRVHGAEAHGGNMGWNQQGKLVHFDWWMLGDPKADSQPRYEIKPRRLNKPVRYDATGIDTPGDPNM